MHGIFNTVKEMITQQPHTLKEPVFIKRFIEKNNQVKELERLLKVAPQEILKDI